MQPMRGVAGLAPPTCGESFGNGDSFCNVERDPMSLGVNHLIADYREEDLACCSRSIREQ